MGVCYVKGGGIIQFLGGWEVIELGCDMASRGRGGNESGGRGNLDD